MVVATFLYLCTRMTREEAIITRMHNQQLILPQFDKAEDIVGWMGMLQAQDYKHFRWAIAMRTQHPRIGSLKEAFADGRIIRTHLFRCTVQAVLPTDYAWMAEICRERNLRAVKSWQKTSNIQFSECLYKDCIAAICELLTGGKSMSKAEIGNQLATLGFTLSSQELKQVLLRGEIDSLLCSGEMNGKDATWALVSERIPLSYRQYWEPQLPALARKYFQSHSPASFEDFCWWTGLPISQNRKAVEQISAELEKIKVGDQEMFLYIANDRLAPQVLNPAVHLLPPYDEYLIGYKSRWIAVDSRHEAKAYNRSGNFWPVILNDGKVVGNWAALKKGDSTTIGTEIFSDKKGVRKTELKSAVSSYRNALQAEKQ